MFRQGLLKGIGLLGLVVLLLLTAVSPASAAQSLQFMSSNEVVIAEGDIIHDDLIVGADRFVLNGTIQGDLIVGGTDIVINGTVEGDLMAAGQSVLVNGLVTDDVRIAGAALSLGPKARVSDDLLALGYSLENQAGSMVEGSVYFAGAQSRLAGHVAHDVNVEAGGLELLGTVGGNVHAVVDNPANAPQMSPFAFTPNAPTIPAMRWGLTVADGAEIAGDLDYSGPTEFAIPVGTVIGKITSQLVVVEETAVVEPAAPFSGSWLLVQLRRLITFGVLGLLLVWGWPSLFGRTDDMIEKRPLASLGWGLVALPALAVAFLALLTTMILLAMLFAALTLDGLVTVTIFLGLLVLFALAVAVGLGIGFVVKILVAHFVGRWLLNWVSTSAADSKVVALLLGLFLFVALTALPYAGGWISFVVVLFGLGALWMSGIRWLQQRQGKPKAAVPPKPALQPA